MCIDPLQPDASQSQASAELDLARVVEETFVRRVEFHRELASTNDLALELHACEELPLLVIAEHQTAGRGRGENRWWSGDGALMFSLLVDSGSTLPIERWPQVSLTVGLAVCESVSELVAGKQIGLKWPNDVYLEGRKACGILIEVPPQSQGRMVLGVGLNVNNSFAQAPSQLQAIATSLRDVAARRFDLTDVLVRVLQQVEHELDLLAGGTVDFSTRWRPLCILQGCEVELSTGPQSVSGICRGIDPQGAILIETVSGEQRFFGGTLTRITSIEA